MDHLEDERAVAIHFLPMLADANSPLLFIGSAMHLGNLAVYGKELTGAAWQRSAQASTAR